MFGTVIKMPPGEANVEAQQGKLLPSHVGAVLAFYIEVLQKTDTFTGN